MKKNKTMRLASVLLVLVLLSTCVISGTFAKYVTSDSSHDEARVAKFGVVITAADSSDFKTEYATDDNAYTGALSVKSNSNDAVVAPGTKSNGINFSITGTPEVATKVDIAMDIISDIFVKEGEHLDRTTSGATDDKFEVESDYYPVVFTLKQTQGMFYDETNSKWVDITGNTAQQIESGNLAKIKTAIEKYAETAYYAPNTDLAAAFNLSWAWDFSDAAENNDPSTNDKADTLLGDVAAGIATDENVSTDIDYTITFTVTQVD